MTMERCAQASCTDRALPRRLSIISAPWPPCGHLSLLSESVLQHGIRTPAGAQQGAGRQNGLSHQVRLGDILTLPTLCPGWTRSLIVTQFTNTTWFLLCPRQYVSTEPSEKQAGHIPASNQSRSSPSLAPSGLSAR